MPGSISARGICKSFPTAKGPLLVINGIDLEVAEGEFVALVGPSGCGKSTFLDILAGFEKPDRGEVLVDGEPLEGPSRRRVLIPQHASVFPWLTVRRNLTIVQDGVDIEEKRRRTLHYIQMVGLSGFETAYPWQLSGGMLKRVEVARALVVKPDIVYMDEPFGSLDALTRIKLQTELLQLLAVERHTALLVTHDVHEATFLADRIVVLGPRPTRIKCIIDVPFERPRQIVAGEVAKLKAVVLTELGLDPTTGLARDGEHGVESGDAGHGDGIVGGA